MLITTGAVHAIALSLMALSLVVLGFNLAGKLFLGDCGTYGVSFIFGLLATAVHAQGTVPLEVVVVWFFIPVADCIRLVLTRAWRRTSPFVGDRDHFHHRLEDKMGQHGGLACYLGAGAVSSIVASLEPRFALVCLILLTSFYFSFAFLTDSAHAAAADAGSART
jgi:UDP-GlcNAc:undecaprenyl-phosphate GlcNAc-1-phosphate transferase